MRCSATQRPVTAPAWAAAVLFAAAGCTICPDPFDYSGPVPDGSAPQNDFRARAKGILTPGAHPLPWPPVVQATPRPGDDSRNVTVVAAREEAAADAGQSADAPVDAAPVDGQPAEVMPAAADVPAAAADPTSDDLGRPPAPQPAVVAEPPLEEILPSPAPVWLETPPPLRETPGWKPRG